MWQLKMMGALATVGKPVIKAGKFVAKKTPKSVTRFKRKAKKFVKEEIKFYKQFPELTAGAAIAGGGLGLGAGAVYKGLTNGKKKKNRFGKLSKSDPNYKALKRAGYIVQGDRKVNMPKVGKKKFSYTKKGKAAAKRYAKKKKKKVKY